MVSLCAFSLGSKMFLFNLPLSFLKRCSNFFFSFLKTDLSRAADWLQGLADQEGNSAVNSDLCPACEQMRACKVFIYRYIS